MVKRARKAQDEVLSYNEWFEALSGEQDISTVKKHIRRKKREGMVNTDE